MVWFLVLKWKKHATFEVVIKYFFFLFFPEFRPSKKGEICFLIWRETEAGQVEREEENACRVSCMEVLSLKVLLNSCLSRYHFMVHISQTFLYFTNNIQIYLFTYLFSYTSILTLHSQSEYCELYFVAVGRHHVILKFFVPCICWITPTLLRAPSAQRPRI